MWSNGRNDALLDHFLYIQAHPFLLVIGKGHGFALDGRQVGKLQLIMIFWVFDGTYTELGGRQVFLIR